MRIEPQLPDGADNTTGTSPRVTASPVDALSPIELHGVPLYFAIARPIGTDSAPVVKELVGQLEGAGYFAVPIMVSNEIKTCFEECYKETLDVAPSGERSYEDYVALMRAGDILRTRFDSGFVAKLAISAIARRRETDVYDASSASGKRGVAYIITHLIHPDEVRTLRATYGSRFFLIGINAPRIARKDLLARKLRDNSHVASTRAFSTEIGDDEPTSRPPDKFESEASQLIKIDAGIVSARAGTPPSRRLNVDKTFQEADLFLVANADGITPGADSHRVDEVSGKHIRRFVRQIFSYPFGTPSIQENAMASAFLAAKSSVSLGRSVGAVVVDTKGSIEASGFNEVAAPGGGPYREEMPGSGADSRLIASTPDYRDHVRGFDPSDLSRVDAIKSFVTRLLDVQSWSDSLEEVSQSSAAAAAWLTALKDAVGDKVLNPSAEAIAGLSNIEALAETRIMNLIEFGRSVHAEVAALSDAARRGISTAEKLMFVTTFPCHECARAIISFGIREVFYVEPYGKSMAQRLYGPEISVFHEVDASRTPREDRVSFNPFVGIAPRALDVLFDPVARKSGLSDADGTEVGEAVSWRLSHASVRTRIVGYPVGFDPNVSNPALENAMLSMERAIFSQVLIAIEQFKTELDGGKS